jgi:bacterial/archaeal transporter family-2 protein
MLRFLIFPFLAGVTTCIQSGVNASLRKDLANPIAAALISFLMGTATLFVIYFFFNKDQTPSLQKLFSIASWKFTGGFLGVYFVMTAIFTVNIVGAGNYTVLVVAGQLVTAMLLDHFGKMGMQQHPINLNRLLGIAFVIVGAVIVIRN